MKKIPNTQYDIKISHGSNDASVVYAQIWDGPKKIGPFFRGRGGSREEKQEDSIKQAMKYFEEHL